MYFLSHYTMQRRTCWLLSRERAANQSHSLIWLSSGILSALTKRIDASKNEFATNSVGYNILYLKQKATWTRLSMTGHVVTYPSAISKSLINSPNRQYLSRTILQCSVHVMLKKLLCINFYLNRHYVFYSTLHFPPYRNRHNVHSCNWHEDGSLALLCTSFAVLQEQNKGRWLVIIRHS